MKKAYSKPTIAVESMPLDQPLCTGCEADFEDIKGLIAFGYFSAQDNCQWEPNFGGGYDTICYHSNVRMAFTS